MINKSVKQYPLQFLYSLLNVAFCIATVIWASWMDGVYFKDEMLSVPAQL